MNRNPPPIDWLLESATPTIRYRTLTRLMGLPEQDPQVESALRAIGEQGPAAEILARQTERGDWANEQGYYTPKYTSTHWAMMLLAELGLDGADERMRRGVDFMLTACGPYRKESINLERHGLECLYGNILRYTAQCGMHEDPRAQALIHYLWRCAREIGWECPINYGSPCAWGAVRALWGLAAIPPTKRTSEVQETIDVGLKMLLEDFSLREANYPVGEGKVSAHWHRLNFPLFYQVDILFTLRVLLELGALNHPGAQPALRWLQDQQGKDGRFRGRSPFRQRTYPGMGAPEETHHWVTLHALDILQHSPLAES